jgi:hypothetical protein
MPPLNANFPQPVPRAAASRHEKVNAINRMETMHRANLA